MILSPTGAWALEESLISGITHPCHDQPFCAHMAPPLQLAEERERLSVAERAARGAAGARDAAAAAAVQVHLAFHVMPSGCHRLRKRSPTACNLMRLEPTCFSYLQAVMREKEGVEARLAAAHREIQELRTQHAAEMGHVEVRRIVTRRGCRVAHNFLGLCCLT